MPMCAGIAEELKGIDLGDERLNKRGKKLLETLAANPEASINAACQGWKETIAAYRFFDNAGVSPGELLSPHREATVGRMQEQRTALVVQDTTELDFTAHPPQGVRCLNRDTRFGLYHHAHLAVTPDKLPLGVLATENFDRAAESLGQTDERTNLPIEDKESFRWLKGYRLACEVAAQCPQTRIVSVADREADLYDIYVEAQEAAARGGPWADYLIRVKADRSTPEPDPAAGAAAYHKVRDEVRCSPLRSTQVIELAATPKRAARSATVEVRALTVQIKPPHARPYLPMVTVNVVLAEEVGGPGDGTDVSWLLISTLPIATLEDVLLCLKYYVARWVIEIYFRMLKTGCRVEEIQLETKARLENCLALYNIIAWRVLYLTYLNRTSPDLPCTTVLDDAEWKSVWSVVKKQPLPKSPPKLSEMMKLITELGGYNNRATELPPGPQPLWVGLRRMLDFATAWLNFGPEAQRPVYK
jgi:transposase-like protein/transposase Tn5 family protein